MADDYEIHREAIITGCVDSFCLACEEYLKCERDVTTHVTKPVHRKNLLAVDYVDKYRDDNIRKIKKGYYCELCNLLLPTADKVGLHVAETLHVDNKATKLLRRIGNTVIALGNVSISERAWHGLMEDTCAICNVEYDNEDIHKNQPSHIIRLIQCKVQYGANKTIYRLIDNDTFQCLTCNMVISLKTITEHFNNSNHQKLYSECLVSANTGELNDPAKNYLEEKDLSGKTITNDKDILENRNDRKNQDNFQLIKDPEIIKNKYESQHIEITNEENRKKISESVNNQKQRISNIDIHFDSSISSSSEHSTENETKPSVSKVKEDPSVSEVATQKLTTNKLSTPKPSSKNNNSFSKQSQSTESFIEDFKMVKNEFMQAKRVIINRKYMVDVKSFMLVTKNDCGFRCQVCEVNFIDDDCTDHVNSYSHKKELNKVPVITSLDTEFVREVRPGLFHCGYCHLLVSDWDTLRTHLKCTEHKEIKTLSKILLDKNIREMEEHERIRQLMFLRMMMGNPFF